MKPIERAASAVAETIEREGLLTAFTPFSAERMEQFSGRREEGWIYIDGAFRPEDVARVVLEAFREPSEGMLAAGSENSGIDGYVNDFYPIVPWQAMIDKALSE